MDLFRRRSVYDLSGEGCHASYRTLFILVSIIESFESEMILSLLDIVGTVQFCTDTEAVLGIT